MTTATHLPAGFHTVTPFLLSDNPDKLIDFAEKALNAKLLFRVDHNNGELMHAQLKIGDSIVMVAGSMGHPTQALLYLYVEDADKLYEQAVAAGAKSVSKPRDEFYGDHVGAVADPDGNQWWLATQKEKLSYDEMRERASKFGA